MTWTTIPDSNIEPGKAVRSVDMIAMRDNIPALAAGDTGAPRIQTAAINNAAVTASKLAVTTNERDWVLGRTAGAEVGAVGTYASIYINVNITPGINYAGNQLRYGSAVGGEQYGNLSYVDPVLSGTWKALSGGGTYGYGLVGLFLRIA